MIRDKELQRAFDAVFRRSTKKAGYYFWDFGNQISTNTFRETMIDLKEGLSRRCQQQLNKKLLYQSIGRFNHQHSSQLHRDTADDHSFLLLGYEPTKVESEVYLADYSQYIEAHQIPLTAFFKGDRDANLIQDPTVLVPYTIQLSPFKKENYRLLLLNKSKSFEEKTFGVFHSAQIIKAIKEEDRILNYTMMRLAGLDASEHYTAEDIAYFIQTNKVNR